jgi:hypothetical protein
LVVWRRQAAQQRDREPDIALLSGAQIEDDQTTGGVRDGVDLGRPSASAAADRLFPSPPFPPALQRWALLVVLSMENAAT